MRTSCSTVPERLEALERENRCWRRVMPALVLGGLVLLSPRAGGTQTTLDQRVAALEQQVTVLQNKTVHFSRIGSSVFLTGANLYIRSGLGATNGYPQNPASIDPAVTRTNGLGNLIIGYQEARGDGTDVRTGSHNLVIGPEHNYASFGGAVRGVRNRIMEPFASVSGGRSNTAGRAFSSVSGGYGNTAGGYYASVSGGYGNTASGYYASVSGGYNNTAGGYISSVSGGNNNTASGQYASVSGGEHNTASGYYTSVSGGVYSTASGFYASVSGGRENTASGESSSASGGTGINQSTLNGWSGGTYTGAGFGLYQGRFRSP